MGRGKHYFTLCVCVCVCVCVCARVWGEGVRKRRGAVHIAGVQNYDYCTFFNEKNIV